MKYDLLMIGSGPAAYSAAMTARKRNLSAAIISAPTGNSWLARTEQVDNYPGLPQVSGKELLRIFEEQAVNLGAEIIHGQARLIQPMGDSFMTLVGNDIIESRAIVLAMGAARPKLLPGEEALIGSGVSWCGTCDGMFYRGKDVAVLSAWHGGVEEADFLATLANRVDYYTMQPHELPTNPVVHLTAGKPLQVERGENGKLLLTTDAGTQAYDGIFVFRPAVAPDKLLPGIQLDGPFIHTDRRMATSIPHVYAAGDCAGKPLQVAKAVGDGNVAAISAAEDLA